VAPPGEVGHSAEAATGLAQNDVTVVDVGVLGQPLVDGHDLSDGLVEVLTADIGE
jgi:hypothetical protein